MQIVSDRGMDLSEPQWEGLENLHLVPLVLTLDGKSYRSGIDIQPEEFYKLLAATDSFPTTSQPSAGDFAEIYRALAKDDPDILSVHISSGLSGTINAARQGAEMVPEANVTFYDTRTLSGAEGWHVEAAVRAAMAGWSVEQIIDLLERISAATETVYTLDEMRYLIHGGRISHIKGLLASVLKIRPVIGVGKEDGKYYQRGQARTFKRAISTIVDLMAQQYPEGSHLRVQVMHAMNPDGAEALKQEIDRRFNCHWLGSAAIAPVLGAHTGPTLAGVAYAPQSVFAGLPWD
ncbi:MAG: DegV family protein [Anaerolineae bacterium]|nr:DegV family protein [Anaerolineae bacterium]